VVQAPKHCRTMSQSSEMTCVTNVGIRAEKYVDESLTPIETPRQKTLRSQSPAGPEQPRLGTHDCMPTVTRRVAGTISNDEDDDRRR